MSDPDFQAGPRVVVVHDWARLRACAFSFVTTVAATYFWLQAGVSYGLGFAALMGLAQGAMAPARKPRKNLDPQTRPYLLPLAAVWLWIVAASAFLVASLLRTIGVPAIEAAGASYIVHAGLSGLVTLLRK